MSTASATTARARPPVRVPSGPALGHAPFPVSSVVVSALAHGLAAAVLVGTAMLWPAEQTRTYVVNLVPAVPAVGTPQGKTATPVPTPPPPRAAEPPKPAKAPPPEAREPEPRTPPPPVAKPAPEPPRPVPDLPTRAKPIDMPARERPTERPSLAERSTVLPDRAVPTRELALPRPGQKELPTIAGATPPKPAALPTPAPAPPTRTVAAPPPSAAPPAAPLGASTGVPQGSGAVLNTGGDFPFAWYLRQITQKINQQWDGRARQGQQPTVVFEITADGRVGKLKVEKSSGDEVYDRVALRAVADASPFPPLPPEFKTPPLRVHLGFAYANERG